MIEIREPKFKEGDKVIDKKGHVGNVTKVDSYHFDEDEYWYSVSCEVCRDFNNPVNYAEKPKTVWDLKEGDTYYVISGYGEVLETTWKYNIDSNSRKIGNAFLTKEEALFEAERRKIEAEMLRLGGRRTFKPDKVNYYIMYDHENRNFIYLKRNYLHIQGIIFFDSDIDAIDVVQEIGEDRIKKYIFGVNE